MVRRNSKVSNFTNRGQHFGNSWVVYSHKARRSLTIVNDIELCYWLTFLEFQPDVLKFNLHPAFRILPTKTPRKILLTSEATLVDGALEWHLLYSPEKINFDYLAELREHANSCGATLREFTPATIIPHKYKVMPLLKVCACLAAGKEYSLPPEIVSKAQFYIRQRVRGRMSDLYEQLRDFDTATVHYLVARMFVEGRLKVELSPYFFSPSTEWVSA